MRRLWVLLVSALLLVACGASGRHEAQHASARQTGERPGTSTRSSTAPDPTPLSTPSRARTSASPPASTTSTPSAPPPARSLPRGGRAIIGHYRVVAYYGAAGAPALGVLGTGPPEAEARAVIKRAQGYAGYGQPVQPAMELLATVAQGSPGPDGDYSAPVPMSVIKRYLAVAHKFKMLLILDLQPGRSTFLQQARGLRSVLLDPSVSLALDPEWKVGAGQRPGNGLIGSSGSDDINRTARYLQAIVHSHRLPDKLLVVHEFTPSMLPDRSAIERRPGVEVSFHADGFGTPRSKTSVFHRLAFPHHPFGVGFKLFLRQDSRLMAPDEVMHLSPRPDIVTYQ